MMMELRPIDRTNYRDCLNLQVADSQKWFVASNAYSLAEAAYEPNLYPLGIYSGERMVGFLLYDYDEDIPGWSMSRLMIDAPLQGQGLGKAAVRTFLAYFAQRHPEVRLLHTTAEVDNPVAIALYEQLGFQKGEELFYDAGGHHYREVRMMRSMA